MSEDTEKLSFEQAFAELEATVQRLEQGDLTLEEAITTYERGMHLAQVCSNALDAAELHVVQLMPGNNQQQLGMFFEDEAG
jgi:exodeoxyribonuclease VII small subunit